EVGCHLGTSVGCLSVGCVEDVANVGVRRQGASTGVWIHEAHRDALGPRYGTAARTRSAKDVPAIGDQPLRNARAHNPAGSSNQRNGFMRSQGCLRGPFLEIMVLPFTIMYGESFQGSIFGPPRQHRSVLKV